MAYVALLQPGLLILDHLNIVNNGALCTVKGKQRGTNGKCCDS